MMGGEGDEEEKEREYRSSWVAAKREGVRTK